MNHQDVLSQANEYVDGGLSRKARRDMEAHLAECAECTREVEATRDLLADARSLPDLKPGRDLWPDIETRLGPQMQGPVPIQSRFTWFLDHGLREGLAAAAALVILVGGWYLIPKPGSDPSPMAEQATDGGHGSSSAMLAKMIWGMEEETRGAGKTMAAAIRGNSNPMTRPNVQSLEESIQVLDMAIEESTLALKDDPDNSRILKRLSKYYRQRLSLMEQATYLSSRS